MMNRFFKWELIGCALLLLLSLTHCASNRKSRVVLDERYSGPIVLKQRLDGQTPEPEHFLKERAKAVEMLHKDSVLLFETGQACLRKGQADLARFYFAQALHILELCHQEVAEFPELEETYYNLLSSIRAHELVALWEPDNPETYMDIWDPNGAPLDEIADLDLYAIEVDPALEHLVSEDLKETPFDFPVVVNKSVVRFLDYYQTRGRKATEEALSRSGRYLEGFRAIFAEEGVPRDLVYMAHVESLFKARAYSRARARGIWQFVAGTARLYDLKVNWWLDERLDAVKATRSAARHLKDLYQEFGDWYLALAGYNGGPGRVSRVLRRYGQMDYWTMAKRRLLPRETRNYVPSILASIIIYKNPERYGFHFQPESPLFYDKIELSHQYDLEVIAESLGVPPSTVAELNPELHRGVTADPEDRHQLKIPVGTGERLLATLAQVPPEKRLRLKHHYVKSGETLSYISAKYGVSIMAIAEANHIRNIHRLRLGQHLVIPLTDWRGGRSTLRKQAAATGRHTVRRGDSLYRISRLYGVKLNDLFRWNGLKPGDLIHPGQKIRVRNLAE
jgi:membrane-bound lytic murein transglycosylase D